MKYTLFRVHPAPHEVDDLVQQFPLNLDKALEADERNDLDAIKQAEESHRQRLLKERWQNPSYGSIGAISYQDVNGDTTIAHGDEKELLQDFWKRAADVEAPLAGWNVYNQDLQWAKVRSWKCGVAIPNNVFRLAIGATREGWPTIVDLRREFLGGPKSSMDCLNTATFDQVMRAFGGEGELFVDSTFDRKKIQVEGDAYQRVLSKLKSEFAQMRHFARRIGIEKEITPSQLTTEEMSSLEQFQRSVQRASRPAAGMLSMDIETAPGDLAGVKQIMGEFDPNAVAVGNLKDPVKIKNKIEQRRLSYDEDMIRHSLTNPLLGHVCAIGYKTHGSEVDIPEFEERELLIDFWKRYENHPGKMGGWNIFGFDIEYLKVRSWILGVEIPPTLLTRAGSGYSRWRGAVDLMHVYNGNTFEMSSLGHAAQTFGHKGKNGDGALFYIDWLSGVPEKRANARGYLVNDLDLTEFVADNLSLSRPPEIDIQKNMNRSRKEVPVEDDVPFA